MEKQNFEIVSEGNFKNIKHSMPLKDNTIYTVVDRVFNTPSKMMKLAYVKSIGKTWRLACDEAMPIIGQRAPNPLNYYVAGIAADLLAQVKKILPENYKPLVEMKFSFREANIMKENAKSYIEKVECNIFYSDSNKLKNEPYIQEQIEQKSVGLKLLKKQKTTTSSLELNTDFFTKAGKLKGDIKNPKSILNGIVIAEKLKKMPPMQSMKHFSKSWIMAMTKTDLTFDEYVIAEYVNVNDKELIKATGYCNLSAYETWRLTADPKGELAPAPLDYLAAGTALCLGTHIMGAGISLKPKIKNFRIEQRMDFSHSNINGFEILSMDNKILIDSPDSREFLLKSTKMAENSCFAGQALQNQVPYSINTYNKI